MRARTTRRASGDPDLPVRTHSLLHRVRENVPHRNRPGDRVHERVDLPAASPAEMLNVSGMTSIVRNAGSPSVGSRRSIFRMGRS